jgi:fatty acid desaturase
VSSFVYFEEPYHRRYAHARHHTYTYHRKLDAQMPPDTPFSFWGWWRDISGLNLIAFQAAAFYKCASGKYSGMIREFTPESELSKLKWSARFYLLAYGGVAVAIALGADFLLWYLVLPRLLGGPVMLLYGMVQHTEMAEESMDIRESTRSFSTNAFNRFIYMNMNYHVEHHLFPTVPFHTLPGLNVEIRSQLPEPDPGFLAISWWSLRTAFQRSFGKVPNENLGRSIPMA